MARVLDELRKLSSDRERGSWELLRSVLEILSEACRSDSLPSALELAELVKSINPAMQALILLSESIRRSRDVCRTVERWVEYVSRARKALIENARRFLENRIVVTISRSSAVLEAILYSTPRKVIFLESRPGSEVRGAVSTLESKGIDVEVVPDSCMARAVDACDIVTMGADAVTIDGYVLNKVGSRPLAMVSKCLGKPLVVLAESLKITRSSCRDLEERVSWRVETVWGEVAVRVFECVEPRYVSYIVTDVGIVKPYREMLELVARELEKRLG